MVLLSLAVARLASLIPPECHHGRTVKFLNYIVTYIATRDVSAYTRRAETGVGFVALRSSDPSATRARYVSFFFFFFFFFFRHLAPLSLSVALYEGAKRADATRMREEATRRNLLRRARPRGGRSYFKICRAYVSPMVLAHVCARVLMATIRWTDGVMVDRCTTSA